MHIEVQGLSAFLANPAILLVTAILLIDLRIPLLNQAKLPQIMISKHCRGRYLSALATFMTF